MNGVGSRGRGPTCAQLLFGLACLGLGCAQRLDQLEPFPCSTENECPTVSAGGRTAAEAHDAVYRCVAGTCVRPTLWTACTTNDECPVNVIPSTCHPELHRCAPTDCRANGLVNLGGVCWPPCTSDTDCVGDEVCQSVLLDKQVCVKRGRGYGASCSVPADCGLGTAALCVRSRCTASCTKDFECRPGEQCARISRDLTIPGVCQTPCGGGKTCPSGTQCMLLGDSSLVPWCISDGVKPGTACTLATVTAPCGGRLSCGDSTSNRCWARCDDQAQCGTGYSCSTYTSWDGLCLPECTSGKACPSGLTCTSGGSTSLCH